MPEEKLPQTKPADAPSAPVKIFSEEKARRLMLGQITLGQYVGLPRQTLYKIATVGHQMLKMGKFDTALEIFDGLVAASPYDSVFQVHRGAALANLERYDEAMEAYTRAINFNIANVDALASRGELYLRKQQAAPAIADLEAAVKADQDGKHPAGQRARALLTLLQRASQAAKAPAEAPAAEPAPAAPAPSAKPPATAKPRAEDKAPKLGAQKPATAEKRAAPPAGGDSFGGPARPSATPIARGLVDKALGGDEKPAAKAPRAPKK